MKLLILGACVANCDLEYLFKNEKKIIQHSSQKMCWHFIRGLDYVYGCEHDLLCTMRVSPYPDFSKIIAFWLPCWKRANGARGRYAPYINVLGLRYFTTFISVATLLALWAWKNRSEQSKGVIVYAMHTPCITAARAVCALFGMHSFMIVPDLPNFMEDTRNNRTVTWLRNVNSNFASWITSRYSGLILFSRNMKDKIDVSRLQWEVVEGCVGLPPTRERLETPLDPNLSIVMYSGALEERYGVQSLLDAFDQLKDPDLRLWICGEGAMSNGFELRASQDPRICYFGSLHNDDVIALQSKATILVNPRRGLHDFTAYSFPSKNLEYMASGRPVILYKLAGMPAEYFDFVYPVNGDTSEDFVSTLQRVLEIPARDLTAMGTRAQDFVYKNKNYLVQSQKIKTLIDRVVDRDAQHRSVSEKADL
jgi:glycosyltransferase involved in cell wall biosynthesis